jgi:hypothetical protein
MTQSMRFALLMTATVGLGACSTLSPVPPDYTIAVAPATADESSFVALPPKCASWTHDTISLFSNQPDPALGCANARNLALQVDNAGDLIKGRDIGVADAEKATGSIRRYRQNLTTGLYDPTSPSPATPMAPDSTATSTASK